MTYLLLGVGILVLLLALGWQFQKASPSALARWARRLGAALAIGFAGYLIVTGRFGPALPALVGGALLLGRFGRLGSLRRGGATGTSGRTSEVATSFLRARLDHDSGAVSGTVLRGVFAGRDLGELAEDELVTLYLEALREDEEAARLVEAYLDRGPHAATWRGHLHGAEPADAGPMSPVEARRVLGVEEGAGEAEIRAAHRRLMMANHPDRGGSAYLAAKINQARDVLLGGG